MCFPSWFTRSLYVWAAEPSPKHTEPRRFGTNMSQFTAVHSSPQGSFLVHLTQPGWALGSMLTALCLGVGTNLRNISSCHCSCVPTVEGNNKQDKAKHCP